MSVAQRNRFCSLRDLDNESDVEQAFVRRLLEALGYPDRAIRTKATLEALSVGGLPGDTHKPDFALKVGRHIRWILEAKHPGENLRNYVDQARGYCDAINASYPPTKQPVRYFVLTNAKRTELYRAADADPLLSLNFADFIDGNDRFEVLVQRLRIDAFDQAAWFNDPAQTLHFRKPGIAEVNAVFAKCHQRIYKSDRISQAAGFVEFVKLITLKLLSDRKIKEAYPGLVAERIFEHPAAEVEFSLHWINSQSTVNPVNSILFRDFMLDVETEIAKKIRKRFFDQGEEIRLKPETIKAVVGLLEDMYLFGIDADLNGRLFENFLSATMRGKDLGQYFTPRTLVKLGVGLGSLQPTDRVLDACCGTGGFLIDALSDMWSKVNRNQSISEEAKAAERKTIADERIYGVDFAKDPNLAKIARLNMYLHGDGGSRIFNIDSLDLSISDVSGDTTEEAVEKAEMRNLDLAGSFDVVLTNPPFSKTYERAQAGDAFVLEQYSIPHGNRSVLAKVLFFEMYHHYLKPGGRLVSVIDDGFLNGADYAWFRDALRELYIVKAVISLPGDAFQRSDARVKTSFVVLEKRRAADPYAPERHPFVFMYACRYVGIDDPKRARWMPGDDELREKAVGEVAEVVRRYREFLKGTDSSENVVPAVRIRDRLDVKHCLVEHDWRSHAGPLVLSDVADRREFADADVINCRNHGDPEQLFTVRYDGTAAPGNVIVPRIGTQYAQLFRVHAGDIVVSNIAVSYGSVAIVPENLAGSLVSREYTVLRAREGYDARIIRAVLRSPEMRAELLMRTTGANRTRVRWPEMRSIAFPYPSPADAAQFIQHIEDAEAARAQALADDEAAMAKLHSSLTLDHPQAHFILDAFKPPR